MLSRVGKMLPGISGGGLFGAGYPGGQLLGGETAGLAIDFTAPNNRLLIRNTSALTNFVGNVFVNDGGPASFSRASLATVVDADGKLKWAAHNLLLASEQFDSSNWAKSSTTVTANTVAAPNGTTTAETVAASGANGTLLQTYTAVAGQYTFGIWLRRKTGTGNIDIAADSGTWTTRTITANWAFYTVDQTPTAGSKSAGLRIVTSGDEVYAWGATLYRSDLGGMQANASAYPMYNPTTPKNLLGQSEAFDVSPWSNTIQGTGINPVVTANAGVAPNGLQTADRIQFSLGGGTTTTDISRRTQSLTLVSGTPYTSSIYLKSYDGNTYVMHMTDPAGTTKVITVTADWQRFSYSANGTGSPLTFAFGLRGGYTPANSNTADVLVWGAQLSDSASLDPYVPNHFAAPSAAAYYGPRLDYDPVTLAPRGLLVEEQRTNLLLRSAEFDNAAWSKTNIAVTANSTVSPAGIADADTVAGVTAGVSNSITQSIVAAAVVYTYSIWVRAGTATTCTLLIRDQTASSNLIVAASILSGPGSVSGSQVVNISGLSTTQWTRVALTTSSAATAGNNLTVYFYPETSLGSGTTAKSNIIWGAQLEAGSFATSYIPTLASSATRSADVASVATSSFPYGPTAGALIVSGSSFGGTGYKGLACLREVGGTSNRNPDMSIGAGPNGVAGIARVDVFDAGVNQAALGATGTFVSGDIYKVGYCYAANDFVSVLNGGTPNTDTSGTVSSSIGVLDIGGRNGANGTFLNGHIRQITYIPRRLTNAELQARTA